MDYQRQSNGWVTFLEHWWFLLVAILAIVVSQFLAFFMALNGTKWIWCYGIALAVAVVGLSLIFSAKLPLYRERRFFTFGSKVVPEERRPLYRWGYRCVIFAAALLLCLVLSRP